MQVTISTKLKTPKTNKVQSNWGYFGHISMIHLITFRKSTWPAGECASACVWLWLFESLKCTTLFGLIGIMKTFGIELATSSRLLYLSAIVPTIRISKK